MTSAVHNCGVLSKTPETSGQPITNSPLAYYPRALGSYRTSTYPSMHAAQLSTIGFMVHYRQQETFTCTELSSELLEYPYQFPDM